MITIRSADITRGIHTALATARIIAHMITSYIRATIHHHHTANAIQQAARATGVPSRHQVIIVALYVLRREIASGATFSDLEAESRRIQGISGGIED